MGSGASSIIEDLQNGAHHNGAADKSRVGSAKAVSKHIDKQLAKEKDEKAQKFSILLLGI